MLLSQLLRLLGIAAKYLVILVIYKYGQKNQLGEYVYYTAAESILVFAIGGEFHLRILSKAAKFDALKRRNYLYNSYRYDVLNYLLFIIIAVGVALYDLKLTIIMIISIFDHVILQTQRFYLFTGSQSKSNVMNSIRSGLWIYPVIIYSVVIERFEFSTFLVYWFLLYASLSAIIKFTILKVKIQVSLNFIKSYIGLVKVSSGYFIATVISMVVANNDKIIIGKILGNEELGRFGFWNSLANAYSILVGIFILTNAQKTLLECRNNNQILLLYKGIKKYYFYMAIIFLFCVAILKLFSDGIIKEEYRIDNLLLLLILLNAILVAANSLQTYVLYAMGKKIVYIVSMVGISLIYLVLLLISVGHISMLIELNLIIFGANFLALSVLEKVINNG